MDVLLRLFTMLTMSSTDPELVDRVMRSGGVDRLQAVTQVRAAQAAATPELPASLLLGLANVESNFDSSATSRLVGGKRKTGAWRSALAPEGAVGNFFCGVTQAIAPTWKRCLELRDPAVAYAAGVVELETWQRRSGSVQRALQGHGCGNAGMRGGCKAYAARVLRRARLFQGTKPTI